MATMATSYPVTVDVDPAREQNRLSVLLRILYVIPAAIVAGVIGMVVGIVALISWFAILITGKHPEGMAKFTAGGLRWSIRVSGYGDLLTDKYPPFSLEDDPAYPVHLRADTKLDGRNRLTTFFRPLLAIPHLIVIGVLTLVACVVALIAWVAALATGTVPEGMHNFLVGWLRWTARGLGYLYLLTDEYPPFSLS